MPDTYARLAAVLSDRYVLERENSDTVLPEFERVYDKYGQ